jgi:hypothetical protein
MDEIKKIRPDFLKLLMIGLGCLALAVFIFGAGVFVGGAKARFSYRWAESYHENFAGPSRGFFGDWRLPAPGDFVEGHGTFGQILKINETDLVVKGQNDVEKIVVFSKDTVIEKVKQTITKADLQVGDNIVVIGSPDDQGQIEAKLIRVFDANSPSPLSPRVFNPFLR